MVSSTQRLLSKLLGAICAPIWMRALMFRLRRFLLVVPALLPSACELVLSGDSLLGLCDDQLGRACEASARGRSRTLAVSAVGAGRVPDFPSSAFACVLRGGGPSGLFKI